MSKSNSLYTQKPRLKKIAFWILAYALIGVALGGYAVAFVLAPEVINLKGTENFGSFTEFNFRFFYNLILIGLYLGFAFLLTGSLLVLNNKRWAKTILRYGVWPCLILAVASATLTFIYGVLGLRLVYSLINYIIAAIIFTFAFIILRNLTGYR